MEGLKAAQVVLSNDRVASACCQPLLQLAADAAEIAHCVHHDECNLLHCGSLTDLPAVCLLQTSC